MTDNRNQNRAYGQGYIGDNLARNIQPVRKPEERRVRTIEKQTPVQQEREARRGIKGSFGFAYALLLTVAVLVIFVSLCSYVSLNLDTMSKSKQVAALRKTLATATLENDNYEMRLNSSINYDDIYRVATEELGMVYASNNQIIDFEQADSEYVVQYKDVE